MRRFAWWLLVAYLLAAPAVSWASPAPNAEVVSYEQSGLRMAAARVKNWISGYRRPGPLVAGSGTLTAIDGAGALVLTSAHLFEDKVGPITVEFTDGQMSGARILAIDQKVDIAALWIFAPKKIKPVPLGQHDPLIGEQVEIWGYGPKRFRSFMAEVALPLPQPLEERRWLLAAQGVQDKQVTIPGDSGGPMVRQGALVGVHWGYTNTEGDPRRYVRAVGCDKVRDWLQTQLSPDLWRRCTAMAN
jgi:Trypsin-like peptidase domain